MHDESDHDLAGASDHSVNAAHPSDAAGGDLIELRNARRDDGPRLPTYRGISGLGVVALLLGFAAAFLCYRPIGHVRAAWLGMGAIALGVLALLIAVARKRAGTGIPLMAVLLGLATLGVAKYAESEKAPGTPAAWVKQKIDRYAPVLQPKASPPAAPAEAPIVAAPVPRGPGVNGTGEDGAPPRIGLPGDVSSGTPKPRDVAPGSIFDEGGAGTSTGGAGPVGKTNGLAPGQNPFAGSVPGTPANRPGTAPPPPPTVASVQNSPQYKLALKAQQQATDKLRGATDTFMYHFQNDPTYKAAKAEVDAADARVQKLKQGLDPYAPALVQAAEARVAAQERLTKVVSAAMDKDPLVIAARRDLTAAEQAVQSVYADGMKRR